jgi:hypothetical protein
VDRKQRNEDDDRDLNADPVRLQRPQQRSHDRSTSGVKT